MKVVEFFRYLFVFITAFFGPLNMSAHSGVMCCAECAMKKEDDETKIEWVDEDYVEGDI